MGGDVVTTLFEEFSVSEPRLVNGTFIEASAGTGKTFSVAAIVARVIALDEDMRIGSIIVTTFTRNAAAELRDRIRRRLVSAERQLRNGTIDPTDELVASLAGQDAMVCAERLARALREFDTATIATIHSVCARILAMAGLPTVGDAGESEIDNIIDEVVNDVVIVEASNDNFFEIQAERLKEVVEKRLSSPRSVLDYGPRSRDSAGKTKDELNVELDHLVVVVDHCVTQIRSRTEMQPTFDDMLRRAAEVLADKGQIALVAALRQRFTLAIIDEAQDTDQLQWEIFKGIFEEKSLTHTLVAVGDPKQAIYRFRGAGIEAYLSARRDDRRLTLRRNWRSDVNLVTGLNHLFDGMSFGEGIDYLPVVARVGAPATSIIGSQPLTIINIGPANNKTRIIKPTAKRVREILATVEITKNGLTNAVRPRDICVLVTTRGTGAAIEAELREMGVSAVSSGTENVMKGEIAGAFNRLLMAMNEPYDSSLIRLVAATPFFGESLVTAGALDDERIEQIQRLVTTWDGTLRRRGVAALAARLRSDEVIAARIVQGDLGERRETDFAHVIELLHKATLSRGCSSSVVLEAIAEFSELEDQSEIVSRRVESDKDAVQIMTVHSAKGLEFPIVVVADLWKKNKSRRGPDTFYRPSAPDPTVRERVIDAGYAVENKFGDAEIGRKKEESEEVIRLFYVALTRARHHVSLIVAEKSDAAPRVVDGLTGPARFAAVADVVETITDVDIKPYPKYVPTPETIDGLTVATFAGSIAQTYQRLSFSGISKKRLGVLSTAVDLDERGGGGHNDDDDKVISIRSSYTDPATPLGVSSMPLARLIGGTYFGNVMHTVYEHIDFAAVDLPSEVGRVVDTFVTGALLRSHRDELVAGVLLSLRTPMGASLGEMTLAAVSLRDKLSEANFEMGLASSLNGVMVNDMGKVLVRSLENAGRTDDILMPYAQELSSDAFAIPLIGLMNGSIDTLLRVTLDSEQRLYVTDWKSNRLDEDGLESVIDGYERESMLHSMEHHHYPLQALIYGVAVHRYVRSRATPSVASPSIAGLAYFFIRGMVGETTPVDEDGNRNGVFTWEAPPELWSELSDVMSGVGR